MSSEFIPGVRAAALILKQGQLLLVREHDPRDGKDFWVPPGGGMETSDDSLLGAGRREVLEETGLSVEMGPLLYYREFRDELRMRHWLEMYFLAHSVSGALRGLGGLIPDGSLSREPRWFSKDQLQSVTVYPEVLSQGFWADVRQEMPEARYLGLFQG